MTKAVALGGSAPIKNPPTWGDGLKLEQYFAQSSGFDYSDFVFRESKSSRDFNIDLHWIEKNGTGSASNITIGGPQSTASILPRQQFYADRANGSTEATVYGLLASATRTHAKARLRELKKLGDDHDGYGASAANKASFDRAIDFIDRIRAAPPLFTAISGEGFAVIEFEDRIRGLFAELTFLEGDDVQIYFSLRPAPSQIMVGPLRDNETRSFADQGFGLLF